MSRWQKLHSAAVNKPSQHKQSALDGRHGVVRQWAKKTGEVHRDYLIEIIADPDDSAADYLLVADGPRYAFNGLHYEHYDTLQGAYNGAQDMKDRLDDKFENDPVTRRLNRR